MTAATEAPPDVIDANEAAERFAAMMGGGEAGTESESYEYGPDTGSPVYRHGMAILGYLLADPVRAVERAGRIKELGFDLAHALPEREVHRALKAMLGSVNDRHPLDLITIIDYTALDSALILEAVDQSPVDYTVSRHVDSLKSGYEAEQLRGTLRRAGEALDAGRNEDVLAILQGIGQDERKSAIKPVTFDSLASTDPAERDPVFEGVLDMSRFAVLIAKSKMRKTFFMMMNALCIASGRKFLAWNTHKARRVMVVQFEVQHRDMHERVAVMANNLGISTADVEDRLFLYNAKATAWDGGGVEAINAISLEAARVEAEVVIVDPLFRLFNEGDESIEYLRPLILALDRMSVETGALVWVVHHDTKGQAGDRDMFDRGSGSNVLGRSAYFQATLTPHENGDSNYVCVEHGGNGYPPGQSFTAQFEGGRFILRDDVFASKQTSATRVKSRLPSVDDLKKHALQIVGNQVIPLQTFKAEMCRVMGLSKQRELDARAVLEVEGILSTSSREHSQGGKKWIGTPTAMEEWSTK